jgi:hypothetical protein
MSTSPQTAQLAVLFSMSMLDSLCIFVYWTGDTNQIATVSTGGI